MAEGADQTNKVRSEPISLRDFYEKMPPAHPCEILDLVEPAKWSSGSSYLRLAQPELMLFCPSDSCQGVRTFRVFSNSIQAKVEANKSEFVTYRCSNCRQHTKIYALAFSVNEDERSGTAFKFGERPAFGPHIPSTMLELLGDQREFFLKGQVCESHGLGLGSFGYYRRVLEAQRNRIREEIIKVAKVLETPVDALATLEDALREKDFPNSVEVMKDAIPDALKINGHNPMTLLHAALSAGLHSQTDTECLEFAQAIRLVLSHLAVRLAKELHDATELRPALAKLVQDTPTKSSDE